MMVGSDGDRRVYGTIGDLREIGRRLSVVEGSGGSNASAALRRGCHRCWV